MHNNLRGGALKPRVRWVVGMLLVAAMSAAIAQERPKFLSSGSNGVLPGLYRVSVSIQPGDELDAISRQLAATYGGRVESYAENDSPGFVVAITDTRAGLLSNDPRVIQVEELATSGFGSYTYDGSGNITSVGDETSKDNFLYDELGRLKSATLRNGPAQTFTYDRYGNILTVTTEADSVIKKLGVDKSTNQIDQVLDDNGQPNNVVGSYDARGNLISYPFGTFVYDGLEMVKEATVDGTRRFHVYSATDERILTIASSGATVSGEWTIRDPGGKALRRLTQTNGSFAWAADYIYRDGELLATAVPGPEKVRHFHLDHLGTPRLVTGNGGAQIAQHRYHPFGPGLPSSTNDEEKAKFTGHERDAATLDYMHARFYDPYMGRFLSVDPAFDLKRTLPQPQRWNRYTYVVNNPINKTDPDGRMDPIDQMELHHPGNPDLGPEIEKQEGDRAAGWAMNLTGLAAGGIVGGGVVKAVGGYLSRNPQVALTLMGMGIGMTGGGVAPGTGQIHHIATNKNIAGGFTKQFESIFAKAGMKLSDSPNLISLPGHAGRHSPGYHKYVLDTLQKATEGLSGKAYKEALTGALNTLRKELEANPDLVKMK